MKSSSLDTGYWMKRQRSNASKNEHRCVLQPQEGTYPIIKAHVQGSYLLIPTMHTVSTSWGRVQKRADLKKRLDLDRYMTSSEESGGEDEKVQKPRDVRAFANNGMRATVTVKPFSIHTDRWALFTLREQRCIRMSQLWAISAA